MRQRKAFDIKKFLAAYNLFQIFACIYYLVNIFKTGMTLDYAYNCYMPTYDNVGHVKLMYFLYLIKGVELIETVCFILKRNFRQVSFLHVYHHVSTFMLTYFGVTQIGGRYYAKIKESRFIYFTFFSFVKITI
jgi:GNS1/SUR4 family